jgi:hypothetical protein
VLLAVASRKLAITSPLLQRSWNVGKAGKLGSKQEHNVADKQMNE